MGDGREMRKRKNKALNFTSTDSKETIDQGNLTGIADVVIGIFCRRFLSTSESRAAGKQGSSVSIVTQMEEVS